MRTDRTNPLAGWALVGWCSLLLATIAIAILFVRGTGEVGLRTLIRTTAQTSFILFTSAFTASSLSQLWRAPWTRWLLVNRRYIGVSFAVSHFIHLIAIVALTYQLGDKFQLSAATVVGGGLAYVFIAAMTATSFDRSAAWLGPRAWRALHTTGVYAIWLIFFVSYAPRAAQSLLYVPLAGVLLAAIGLRLFARLRSRRHLAATAAAAAN